MKEKIKDMLTGASNSNWTLMWRGWRFNTYTRRGRFMYAILELEWRIRHKPQELRIDIANKLSKWKI